MFKLRDIAIYLAICGLLTTRSLAAEKIDATYAQPGFAAAVFVHPKLIFDAPMFKTFSAEEKGQVIQKLQDKLHLPPIDLRSIEEIQVYLGPAPAAIAQETPVCAGVVVHFNVPADQKKISSMMFPLGEQGEVAGKKYVRVGGHPTMGFCFVDEKTLVFGDEESVRQMLKGPAAAGPLVDMLSRMDSEHAVIAAGLMDPFRQMLAGAAKDAGRGLPPTLKSAVDAPNQVKWAAVTLDISGDSLAKVTLEGTDAAAGAGLAGTLGNARDMLKQAYAMQRPKIEADTPLASRATILTVLDELVAGLSISQEGTRVALNVKAPAGLTDLPAKLKPMIDEARQRAARYERMSNLRQLQFALQAYAANHNEELPPQSIADKKTGKPLLSWRVAILPFLEAGRLYDRFHMDEPWDSPHNRELIAEMPQFFGKKTKDGKTSIFVFAGPGTLFDGAKGHGFGELANAGSSNIMAIVEAGSDKAVPWTKPEDLTVDPKNPVAAFGTLPDGKFIAVFFDGHVQVIDANEDPAKLRSRIFAKEVQPAAEANGPKGSNAAAAPAGSAENPVRTWTDATGTRKVEAQLIAVEGANVRIKRADGKIVVVPLDHFSEADQGYLKAVPAKP